MRTLQIANNWQGSHGNEGKVVKQRKHLTLAAGHKIETGSQCTRNWFYSDARVILTIEDTFRRHADYTLWVVLGTMLKKECGA